MSDPNQPPRPEGENHQGASRAGWPPPAQPPGDADDRGYWSTPPGSPDGAAADARPEPQYGQYAPGDPYHSQGPGYPGPQHQGQYQAQYPGQYQGGYAQPYGGPQYQPRPSSALAITSLVLGILSVIGFCIPILAPLLGVIAIILAIVVLSRVKSGRAGGRGMAIGGLVTGLLGVVLGISLLGAMAPLFNEIRDCAQQPNQEAIQRCLEDLQNSVRSGQIGN